MADEIPNEVLESMDPPNENEKAEQDDVKALWTEYEEARTFDKDARKQYGTDRSYASGDSGKNWASDANLIGTFIDILSSFLYARDPDVDARAAMVVGGVEKNSQLFAETAGLVISRLWKKARLKRAARKMVRSGLTVGPGWLKVIMTHETENDPVVQKELNDLQDNLERLQFVASQLEEGDADLEEQNVLIKEQERLRDSLQANLEVVRYRGLAIDYVLADDMQVSLDVPCIADYLDADWNGNEIFIRVNDVRRRFPRINDETLRRATVYHQIKPKVKDDGEVDMNLGDHSYEGNIYRKAGTGSRANDIGFVRVVEVWDNRDKHVKTLIEGCKIWARLPYKPSYATTRFYPYFGFFLFEVDGKRHSQSLSTRLKKLQDEYSSKRSNSKLHAERSVGATLFDKQAISEDDATKIEQSVAQEFIGIEHVKGDDLRKAFAAKPVATVDPGVFDTRSTIADMERISGVQEALSSAVTTQKTATEAKIQDQGFNSRSSADRDTLEDLLQDLSEYTLELAIQAIPYEDAVRLAGKKAFWPEGMAVEDILTLAEVDIKAGTTGKPNQQAEQQAWSVVLPLVQSIMGEVQKNQLLGNMPLAEALVNLLKETFRRLDERINVDQFIPQGLPNLQGADDPDGGEGGDETPEPGSGDPAQTSADANVLV